MKIFFYFFIAPSIEIFSIDDHRFIEEAFIVPRPKTSVLTDLLFWVGYQTRKKVQIFTKGKSRVTSVLPSITGPFAYPKKASFWRLVLALFEGPSQPHKNVHHHQKKFL